MGDGTKLAIAILMLFLAGIGFFIAFHPNGLNLPEDNAPGILQWFMSEFEGAATGNPVANSTDPGAAGSANSSLPAPGVGNSSNLTNTSNVGPTTSLGTNSADLTNTGG